MNCKFKKKVVFSREYTSPVCSEYMGAVTEDGTIYTVVSYEELKKTMDTHMGPGDLLSFKVWFDDQTVSEKIAEVASSLNEVIEKAE